MAIFITQGRFTHDAIKGMIARPEDRSEQVGALIAAAGAKLLAYYVTLGEYDFLVISEGDIELQQFVAALMVAAAGGGVTNLKSTVGMTSAEAKVAFERAGSLAASFRSAGQA